MSYKENCEVGFKKTFFLLYVSLAKQKLQNYISIFNICMVCIPRNNSQNFLMNTILHSLRFLCMVV